LTRVFLGLGSNLGDQRSYLRDAVDSLRQLAPVRVSGVFETEPMGGPSGQGSYLNIVAELDTDLTPRSLLGVCHRLETAADRERHERWGPRTLDVDIIWMDGVSIDEPDLQIPHPRMLVRRFVMAPLAELAPDVVPDDWADHAEGRVSRVGEL
jgi:2-amino-4-hydroxy-6-hydroxymethyldihydropteridine diphosphokinase